MIFNLHNSNVVRSRGVQNRYWVLNMNEKTNSVILSTWPNNWRYPISDPILDSFPIQFQYRMPILNTSDEIRRNLVDSTRFQNKHTVFCSRQKARRFFEILIYDFLFFSCDYIIFIVQRASWNEDLSGLAWYFVSIK